MICINKYFLNCTTIEYKYAIAWLVSQKWDIIINTKSLITEWQINIYGD